MITSYFLISCQLKSTMGHRWAAKWPTTELSKFSEGDTLNSFTNVIQTCLHYVNNVLKLLCIESHTYSSCLDGYKVGQGEYDVDGDGQNKSARPRMPFCKACRQK